MTIKQFATLMKKYLKAVDRVATAPSNTSYRERVAKEKELRVEVEAALKLLTAQSDGDDEWLAKAKNDAPTPRKRGRPKKVETLKPADADLTTDEE